MSAFTEDLQRYLRDEPIHARPDTFVYRAAKFVKRHRLAVSLATAVVLAIVAGLIGTLVQVELRASNGMRPFENAIEPTASPTL